jgi:predicted small lipoprotein YifL
MCHAFPHPCGSRPFRPVGLTAAALLLVSLTACGRSMPPNVSPPGETTSPSQPGLPHGSAAHKETAK